MNKKGFLLVELIVSLTAFSCVLLVCGYFFLYITASYKYNHDHINGMMHVQNDIEKVWLGQDFNPSDHQAGCPALERVALPLPERNIDLPHTILPLDYYGWSLSARSEAQEKTVIPGCVCEKKR